MTTTPKPVRLEKLHSWKQEGDGFAVSFTASDGQGRSIRLSHEAALALLGLFQNLPEKGQSSELSTLTVLAHNTLRRADGLKGLALRTRERGVWAFNFSSDAHIRQLASDLAELAEAPASSATH